MQHSYDGIRIKARLIHRTYIFTLIRKWYNWFLCWLSIKCKYDTNASLSNCIDSNLCFHFNVSNIVRSYDRMIHSINIYMLIIHWKLSYDTDYKLNACICIICKMYSWSSVCRFYATNIVRSFDRMIHSSNISIIMVYCKRFLTPPII